MSCLCGDSQCPSCGSAQDTVEPKYTKREGATQKYMYQEGCLPTQEQVDDLRKDAEFTRDRVGQEGCQVRLRAEALVDLLDYMGSNAISVFECRDMISQMLATRTGEVVTTELIQERANNIAAALSGLMIIKEEG